MRNKVQTGISITKEAQAIIKARQERDGLNFSSALELIIREWHRDRQSPPPVAPGICPP